MTEAVRNILKNYGGDNPGVLSNLARILNHGTLGGTGKLVILPIDQGFEHGPAASFSVNPPAYDPAYHFKLAIESGCSALAAPFGFLDSVARDFVGDIPLILKANSSDSLYKNSDGPLPACTAAVEEACRLGCSAVGFTIYPGSQARQEMYEQASLLGQEARKHGLPLVIWSYPRGEQISKEGETALDVVAYAAQIAAQLGAHIIKVKPPANFFEKNKEAYSKSGLNFKSLSSRVEHVIQSAFEGRKLVIFSGGASKTTEDVLAEIKELAKGGSFGSIVGRNAFQRSQKDALKLLKDIMQIYKSSAK